MCKCVKLTAATVDTEKLPMSLGKPLNSLSRYNLTFFPVSWVCYLEIRQAFSRCEELGTLQRERRKKERKKQIRKDYTETSMLHSTS